MISSAVIRTEASRQGVNEPRPCPGDILNFTCKTQTTDYQAASFMSDIVGLEDLIIFRKSNKVGSLFVEGTPPGITGILLNNITFEFMIMINLTESTAASERAVVNGTGISCGEIDQRRVNSTTIFVDIIGKSSPTVTCFHLFSYVHDFNSLLSMQVLRLLLVSLSFLEVLHR